MRPHKAGWKARRRHETRMTVAVVEGKAPDDYCCCFLLRWLWLFEPERGLERGAGGSRKLRSDAPTGRSGSSSWRVLAVTYCVHTTIVSFRRLSCPRVRRVEIVISWENGGMLLLCASAKEAALVLGDVVQFVERGVRPFELCPLAVSPKSNQAERLTSFLLT